MMGRSNRQTRSGVGPLRAQGVVRILYAYRTIGRWRARRNGTPVAAQPGNVHRTVPSTNTRTDKSNPNRKSNLKYNKKLAIRYTDGRRETGDPRGLSPSAPVPCRMPRARATGPAKRQDGPKWCSGRVCSGQRLEPQPAASLHPQTRGRHRPTLAAALRPQAHTTPPGWQSALPHPLLPLPDGARRDLPPRNARTRQTSSPARSGRAAPRA